MGTGGDNTTEGDGLYNFALPGLGDVRMAAVWIVAPVCGSGLTDDLPLLGQRAGGDGAGRTMGREQSGVRCRWHEVTERHSSSTSGPLATNGDPATTTGPGTPPMGSVLGWVEERLRPP